MKNYPKSLADLKRYLQVGVKLYKEGPGTLNSKGFTIDKTTRAINLIQTNAIRFEPLEFQSGSGSYLEFGKAKDYTFLEDGFIQSNDCGDDLIYKYVE